MYGGFQAQIEHLLQGRSVRGLSRESGLSETVIRAYRKGSDPSRRSLLALAKATGASIEWLVTGRGQAPERVSSGKTPCISDQGVFPEDTLVRDRPDPALIPVSDRRLATILAVLGDEWDALNEAGRASLVVRFWAAHPDLRERESRLARVVGWLGWRVIEGRRGAQRSGSPPAS